MVFSPAKDGDGASIPAIFLRFTRVLKGFDSEPPVAATAATARFDRGNLVITRASGGRWRFDLKLEATEPEVGYPSGIEA